MSRVKREPAPWAAGTCAATGKRCFDSRKHARRTLRAFAPGERQQAYRCSYCGWWHLGHIPHSVSRGTGDKAAWLAHARKQQETPR